MANPWERYQTQPAAPAAADGPWTRYQTPAAPPAGVDLTRQPAIDDATWFRNAYGRDPISADQAGTNDPAAFRRTFGFDPVGPQAPNGVLGEDPYAIRALLDPAGHAAYQAELQRGLPQTTTAGWDEQGFDTNNSPLDWVRAAGQGIFGLGDEAEGVLGGVGGILSGKGWQQGYDRSVTNARNEITEYDQAHPTASTLLGIAGAAPTMLVPGMSAAARGVSTLSRVGRGVLAGAATGGLTGFGLGEGSPAERLPSTLQGALPGAAVGGLLPLAAPLVARALTGRAGGSALAGLVPESADTTASRSMLARQAPMTGDELRDAGEAAYQRADDAGVRVASGAYDDLVLTTAEEARRLGMNHILTPRSNAALEEMFRVTGRSQYTIDDLNILRRVANMAAISPDPSDANIGRTIRDGIDDWLEKLDPKDIIGGDPAAAAAALREARDLWGRYRRMETLDQIQERALNAVGANYSAAGAQTALRQQFRALANSREFKRFPLDEQQAIRDIVRGGPMENALRRIGAFAPRGFFSTMFAFGGASTGNIPMMALSAAGEVSKRMSTGMTNSAVSRLRDIVGGAGGGVLPPNFGTQQAVQGLLGAGNAYLTPRLTLIPEQYLPVPAGLQR